VCAREAYEAGRSWYLAGLSIDPEYVMGLTSEERRAFIDGWHDEKDALEDELAPHVIYEGND